MMRPTLLKIAFTSILAIGPIGLWPHIYESGSTTFAVGFVLLLIVWTAISAFAASAFVHHLEHSRVTRVTGILILTKITMLGIMVLGKTLL